MPNPDWPNVYQHAEDLRLIRGWTKEQMYKETGVSEPVYNGMADGRPIRRSDKLASFMAAMPFDDEELAALLAGEKLEPGWTTKRLLDEVENRAGAFVADVVSRLAKVEGIADAGVPALRDLQNGFEALRTRLTAVEAEVRALKRRPRPPRASDG